MKIDIKYLFSRNKLIGSRAISWGTKHLENVEDTPSHVAVLLNSKWVVESTLETGVRVISYAKWKIKNREVEAIECLQSWTMAEIKELFRPLKGLKYDYLGVLYFGWKIALNKLLRIKIPVENKFSHDNKYFCCEVIGKMTGVDYDMTSPVQLMVKIQKGIEEFRKN